MNSLVFTVVDQFRRSIRLTAQRHAHIVERREMAGQEERIRETLALPEVVKTSRDDPRVLCYYRWYDETPVTRKYLLCIVRTLDHEGFVVTAFYPSTRRPRACPGMNGPSVRGSAPRADKTGATGLPVGLHTDKIKGGRLEWRR